jgi:hypothetical protein
MTITNNVKFNVQADSGVVPEAALVEGGANLVEAVPVTMTGVGDLSDWTYSATAEDAGTAGNLDAQPGLIYNGPNGNYFRVAITNADTVEHAITAPEATDTAALALFKNSEVQDYGDEGFNAHASEIAVENNIDTLVGPFNEGDVLRVGFVFTGEADGDLDLAPGEISIT